MWRLTFTLAVACCVGLSLSYPDNLFSPDPMLPEDTVRTRFGLIKGELYDDYRVFRGIPYALPPTGNLRFRAPQKWNLTWDETRDATEFGSFCPYIATALFGVDEDCLFLNVWTPRLKDFNNSLPVYFFSPGGGFVLGNGNYDATVLMKTAATFGNFVVLVTMNYRLGPLGFLALPQLKNEDPSNPSTGNYGMQDQLMAMHWVAENIEDFGGDNKSITLLGASAGAISACAFLAKNPQYPVKVFSQVAMQSFYCNLIPLDQAYENGKIYLAHLMCDYEDAQEVLDCLRSRSSYSVVLADGLWWEWNNVSFPERVLEWWPTIDGSMFLEQPEIALANGNFDPIPALMGSNLNETSPLIYFAWPFCVSQQDYDEILSKYFGNSAGPLISQEYQLDQFDSPQKALTQITSDYLFHCPALQTANDFLKYGEDNVYLYSFERSSGLLGKIMPFLGAFHGTELPYLMDMGAILNFLYGPRSDGELELESEMGKYWLNFVRSGTPNHPNQTKVWWDEMLPNDDKALILDVGPSLLLDHSYDKYRCGFWKSISVELNGALKFHQFIRKHTAALQILAAIDPERSLSLFDATATEQAQQEILDAFQEKLSKLQSDQN